MSLVEYTSWIGEVTTLLAAIAGGRVGASRWMIGKDDDPPSQTLAEMASEEDAQGWWLRYPMDVQARLYLQSRAYSGNEHRDDNASLSPHN